MNVNDAPIFVMSCVATLSMIATIGIFWAGIFALLGGRDTVWECSWQWPARLLGYFQTLGEMHLILGMRAAFVRWVTDEPRRQSHAPHDVHLHAPVATRRPVSGHYLTVGARARQRGANQRQQSRRHAA